MCFFSSTRENGVPISCCEKLNNVFKYSKRLNIFSTSSPFLEKIFHPHPHCEIRGSHFSLFKGEVGVLEL